ncbi:Protein CWH43 [Exophiala dermatitidis]
MAPRKDGDVVFSFNGKYVSWAHTVIAYAAFLGALIVGVLLHYHKIVQNEHYGYPDEWFPSVSATIGDRYPERSVFMVFIALTAGPRFALVGLWYFLTRRPNSNLPGIIAAVGLFRTFTCGGWTYVTSTDDHDWHDIFMISYLVATLPWTLGCLALSPPNPKAIKYRKILAGLFFGTLVPLIYFFIQHKVHRVAGAYTIYAFFEWSLILFDVAFDAVTAFDFETFELVVKDVKGMSRGDARLLKDSVKDKERDSPFIQTSTFEGPYYWPAMLDAAADIFHGFIFWSILTSLGVLVWYFPLWHMGISGYEVMVMSTISPLMLGVPFIRSLTIKYLRWVHLSSLVGLLAWLVKDPANRLFTVGFAVWMGCLAWSAEWYAERRNSARLQSRILAWCIGLVLSSIAKFANHTNNPVWPILHSGIGGWNKTGLLLGILAIWRSTRPISTSGGDYVAPNARKGSGLLAGVGFGGLVFAMHSLLSDSSTMILWVWEGYPVRGPLAVPHGAVTIFVMSAGLFLGVAVPRFFGSWTAYGLGALGATFLTLYGNWKGYYGALVLAFYIMGVAPVLISSAVEHNPALTFGLGFFVYNLMVLFHVWVVAYAFVPGGPLVREHTDWIMITMMLMIGAGVFSALTTNSPHQQKNKSSPRGRKQSTYYLHLLLALQLLAASVAYLRFPTNDYQPYHKDEKLITAGIWTIHFSLDNDMWSSERRMRDAIKELELDVVGLLESDLQRIIMGNRDTTQYLAEDLGMYVDYGPGPNKHTWGAALLSKFPILNSTHHLLPSPVGELAPAIEATLDVYGTPVDVFVFHSGQEEDPEDRRLQSEYLARIMKASPRPSILLSYLVIKPEQGNYNTYVGEKSGMHDIDVRDWDRWCEYILYKDIKRVGYARVSRGTITDTEIQVGKFVVGEPVSYSDERIPEDQVPPGRRFPTIFLGEGVRGHRYHVFDEPWYYA